jgi:hypothetical protein
VVKLNADGLFDPEEETSLSLLKTVKGQRDLLGATGSTLRHHASCT